MSFRTATGAGLLLAGVLAGRHALAASGFGTGSVSHKLALQAHALVDVAGPLAYFAAVPLLLMGILRIRRAVSQGTGVGDAIAPFLAGFGLLILHTAVPGMVGEGVAPEGVAPVAALAQSAPVVPAAPPAPPKISPPLVAMPPPRPPAPVLSPAAEAELAQLVLVRRAVDDLYGRGSQDYRGLNTAALVRARLMPPEMVAPGYRLLPAAGASIDVTPADDGHAFIISLSGLAAEDCRALAGAGVAPLADQACLRGHVAWRLGQD